MKRLAWLFLGLGWLTGCSFSHQADEQVAGVEGNAVQVVGNVRLYFGMVPAPVVSTVQALHAPPPSKGGESPLQPPAGEHHLLLALFDANTGERIEQAEVVTDSTIDGQAVHRPLEPMRINDTTTFGNMFNLAPDRTYRFTTTVRRPGQAQPVIATYVYTTAHPMHQERP